ncbi:peptidyl-prolyl cis-trans isomerase-like 2 [Phaffia rhodozyma]|uniref:Peptidyl-prolyl cis-trans isomerase-like 2 n=1 Tax=Phaffia rhodozyma TaxID=264483 RepID=A0A0F7SH51_PHARH|nr:peptidyl-prolyl cis-trans isomerase-like 2 [Phaffia rhodozyma]
MGHNSDKLYVTHSEHAAGSHTAGGGGYQGVKKQTEFQALPFDCCALSLTAFQVPVAVKEEDGTANVFDLVNILPYIKKFGTNPVTGRPLTTASLIKLHFFKNDTAENKSYSDPVTFKPFTPHTHIVFVATTGNVFSYESVDRLCIKTKAWRDLITDEKFTRADIVTIQDPHNLSNRDLSKFDYVANKKSAGEKEADRLSGINVNASGSAAKILQQIAQKNTPAPPSEETQPPSSESAAPKEKKVGIVAPKPVNQRAYNAASYSTGLAAASLTSTAADIETRGDRALIDEEEFMFDEISSLVKEKDRAKRKAYLKVNTNFGALNLELHCDKAPKTCYNFIMLAKEGKYDGVIFHRNIPGFMIQGGDPTGKGTGGNSFWGHNFRDEYDLKGALKHTERGTLSMANHGAGTNGSQFFLTYRPTSHLDGKHTVFGNIVGGMDVLNVLEKVPVNPATDRPTREIKIINVEIFQDPYAQYQTRLANKLAAQSQSALSDKNREKTRLERESDRTSWFGEDLDRKKADKAEIDRKRKAGVTEDDLLAGSIGVGKYLAEARNKKINTAAPGGAGTLSSSSTFGGGGVAKKRKPAGGGFGDFSSW